MTIGVTTVDPQAAGLTRRVALCDEERELEMAWVTLDAAGSHGGPEAGEPGDGEARRRMELEKAWVARRAAPPAPALRRRLRGLRLQLRRRGS